MKPEIPLSQATVRAVFATPFLLLCVLLGGCGQYREVEPTFTQDSSPVTLTYIALDDSLFSEAESVAIERFTKLAPNFEIDRQTFQRSAVAYLEDTLAPDVIWMAANLEIREAAAAGLLSDLSDVWQEGNFSEAFSQSFQDISRIDDAFRFVPAGFSWTGFFYNREVFERYDLTPPTNWEEFEHICDTLLTYGETPISLSGQNPFVTALWFDYLNLRLNGSDFHQDLIAGRVSFHDERVGRVWRYWVSLLDRDYFVKSPGDMSETESMTALIRGDTERPLTRQKAVMTLAPHFSLNQLPPAFVDELDFFQFPQMDAAIPLDEVSIVVGYVIPAGAPNRFQAGAFVRFMGSAEAQALQRNQVSEDESHVWFIPAHRDVDRSALSPIAAKGDQAVRNADSINPPLMFELPASMREGFVQVSRRLFPTISARIQVAEIQSMLEEARQAAIQKGEPPL
ncbi:MAG: extracellular solute-binding protein [Caldilineaceae bacterium]|nr:extracellular solute-binding protein [Caldilineaceae bacterium]